MNEHGNSPERLFAHSEPDIDDDGAAFVALVHQRVVKQRRLTRALELCMYAPIVVAAAIVVIAPEVLVYPVQLLHGLLSLPFGAATAATTGLAWWSRFGDA